MKEKKNFLFLPQGVQAFRVAVWIAAIFLSLLCGIFYNLWKYEIERIHQEKGSWQSRITGEIRPKEIESIRNFAHVKNVVVYKSGTESKEVVLDIYFDHMGAVLEETLQIAGMLGILPEESLGSTRLAEPLTRKISYNDELLAMYLIRSPQDTAPRLLFPMFLLIMALASGSLIMIIHHSFAVSMNSQMHQLGIFSSIGATPGQIRGCLLREAALLCAVPVAAGNALGLLISMGFVHLSNVLGDGIAGRHTSVFSCHPLVLVWIVLVTVITIGISAWIPTWKLSRITPLEAIKNTNELQLKRKKNSGILFLFFGVEGELAGNALKAQKKALKTSSLSLILSLLAFTVMQCFFSMSEISTRETYFARYQDAWDIMLTVKKTGEGRLKETNKIQQLPGVKSAVVYQKAMAKRWIAEEELSEEAKAFGGFSHASAMQVVEADKGWLVNAPFMILDDNSFLDYCAQIGIAPQLHGAVLQNQIRDVTNPDFRHPQYMPYIKENSKITTLSALDVENTGRADADGKNTDRENIKIPVLSYTTEVPLLREEYATLDYYEMVHFIPESLWEEIKGQLGGSKEEIYIRILCEENAALEQIEALQREIEQIIGMSNILESENRIEEYTVNNQKLLGMKAVLGSFCVLLALIGMGNVFSNTLGFVHQRKREFARYRSIGMTLEEIRKMFCIEALVIAVRPVLAALPLAVFAVGYMLKLSYLAVDEFLAEAPYVPIIGFVLVVWGSVALAYVLAWKGMHKISLADVLRDDTML